MQEEDSMAKTWVKEKIQSIKKKTSIGDSRLSRGAGTNKRKTRKNTGGKANEYDTKTKCKKNIKSTARR